MKDFAALYRELDASTSSLAKQAALQRLPARGRSEPMPPGPSTSSPAASRASWCPTKLLRLLAQEAARPARVAVRRKLRGRRRPRRNHRAAAAGPPSEAHELGLGGLGRAAPAAAARGRQAAPRNCAERLRAQWRRLAAEERLVYFKLITGAFRVGVSKLQVTQALAAVGGIDAKRVAQRLMGYTHIGARPRADDYRALIAPESDAEQVQKTSGQPYPFFLAHPFNLPLEQFDAALGATARTGSSSGSGTASARSS